MITSTTIITSSNKYVTYKAAIDKPDWSWACTKTKVVRRPNNTERKCKGYNIPIISCFIRNIQLMNDEC